MADLFGLWRQHEASAVKITAEVPEDGFIRSEQLPLPPGDIVSSEGVRLLRRPRLGRCAMAVEHEAWVVVRLGNRCCNAIWRPDLKGWDLVRVDLGEIGGARLISKSALPDSPDIQEVAWR